MTPLPYYLYDVRGQSIWYYNEHDASRIEGENQRVNGIAY